MKNIANVLLSVSLVMGSTSAFANLPNASAPSFKPADKELWHTLKSLQRFRNAQDVRSKAEFYWWSGAGLGVGGAAALYAVMLNNIRAGNGFRAKDSLLALGIFGGLSGLGMLAPKLMAESAQKESHPNGYATSSASVAELDAREIDEIADVIYFLRKPLPEQYNKAIRDPEMRNYLVNLNQWFDRNMVVEPPPVRPVELPK